MSEEMKKYEELFKYMSDHIKHFGYMPTEFEYDGEVYDIYLDLLPKEDWLYANS